MFNFKSPSLHFVVLPWVICTGERSFLWSNLGNERSLQSEYPCKYCRSLILQAITFSVRSLPSKTLSLSPYPGISLCSLIQLEATVGKIPFC